MHIQIFGEILFFSFIFVRKSFEHFGALASARLRAHSAYCSPGARRPWLLSVFYFEIILHYCERRSNFRLYIHLFIYFYRKCINWAYIFIRWFQSSIWASRSERFLASATRRRRNWVKWFDWFGYLPPSLHVTPRRLCLLSFIRPIRELVDLPLPNHPVDLSKFIACLLLRAKILSLLLLWWLFTFVLLLLMLSLLLLFEYLL